MNLLLLLSAMLSALTGIGSSARVAETTAAITTNVSIAAVAGRAAVTPSPRPLQSLPSLSTLSVFTMASATPLYVSEPLYASRRRE